MPAQTPGALAVGVRSAHLKTGYSPEQIAGQLRRAYPDDMPKRLSIETIYAALYVLPLKDPVE